MNGNDVSFSSADQLTSGSAAIAAFHRASAQTSDALLLSTPGTSGSFTYRYVGGGLLERARIIGNDVRSEFDAFVYGLATPDANLTRTGTGTYGVGLVGIFGAQTLYSMSGEGTLQADFANGIVESRGLFAAQDNSGLIVGQGTFFGRAQIAASANSFAGEFKLYDGSLLDGGWQGQFFGPNADEVGAGWQVADSSGRYATGWLTGRQDANVAPYNFSLATLSHAEDFEHRYSEFLRNKQLSAGDPIVIEMNRSSATLAYDPGTATYRYVDARLGYDTNFAAQQRLSAASNNNITVYERADGGSTYRLSLSTPGAGNSEIALTYASLGRWQRFATNTEPGLDRWFAWGVRTSGFQIPTGTASYTGLLKGSGGLVSGATTYELSGAASFALNFDSGSFTGSLAPVGLASNGTTRSFGTYSFSNAVISSDGSLAANIAPGGNYLGFFEGALYGPSAQELGGTFGIQTEATSQWMSQNAAYLTGAVVAKKDTP